MIDCMGADGCVSFGSETVIYKNVPVSAKYVWNQFSWMTGDFGTGLHETKDDRLRPRLA